MLLFVISYILNQSLTFRFKNEQAAFIVVYLFVLTLLMHLALRKTFTDRPQAFVHRYMGFSGLRLVLHFFLLIAYWFVFKNLLVSFTVHFLILYLLFTIFEVYFLYQDIKHLPKSK